MEPSSPYADAVVHPDGRRYERACLRLMPAEGGAPRATSCLYGSQSTINVPSWSPDGTMLAFVGGIGID